MNDFYQENKRALLLMVTALILFALVLYLLVVQPLMKDYAREEKAVVTEQKEIQAIQQQLDTLKENAEDVDIEKLLLEKKIPSERQLAEYILTLQELEEYTGSALEQIKFTYDSSLESLENAEDEASTNEVEQEIDETGLELEDEAELGSDDAVEGGEAKPNQIMLDELPVNLEMFTVSVTAQVTTFDELINLIKAIEDQDRISIVSRMHFIMPAEEEKFFSEDQEFISLQMDLSTFYYAD